MRRSLAVTAAAALLAPLAALPLPASAATTRLTVIAIDRSGARVSTSVSVLNMTSGATYTLTSGRAKALPGGVYAALTDVRGTADGTDTLGAGVVTVSGSTTLTIDARHGLPVRMSLRPAPPGTEQGLLAGICAKDDLASSVSAWNSPGNLYVIPNASRLLQFGVVSNWSQPSASTPTSYIALGTSAGLPKGYSRTVNRSELGRLAVTARRGPAGAPTADVAVQPAGTTCSSFLYQPVSSGTTPFRVTTYLTPGSWTLRADSMDVSDVIGSYFKPLQVRAGKSYAQGLFTAAWAPGQYLPTVIRGRLSFFMDGMFTDPGFPTGLSGEAAAKALVTLRQGGRTLKQQTRTSWGSVDTAFFSYSLRTAGWYALSIDAHRYHPGLTYPADMLSPRTTASFSFYADPKADQTARVFLVRFVPAGLNLVNHAPAGSRTTVALTLDRPARDPDAKLTSIRAKSVTAQASFDEGKTWRSVRVTQSGGRWSAVVPNPASGMVSLRATVTSSTGDSSTITVYRAYGIG